MNLQEALIKFEPRKKEIVFNVTHHSNKAAKDVYKAHFDYKAKQSDETAITLIAAINTYFYLYPEPDLCDPNWR